LPKYLIVNGDDLGTSAGVNRGILEAHRNGILTSASLMVDGPAAEEGGELARGEPGLSVGLHLVLEDLGEGSAHDPGAVTEEVRRQLDAFEQLLGGIPSHLDTHHDRHRDPGLLQPLLAAAIDLDVPLREHGCIRYVSRFYGRWGGVIHPEQISVEGLLGVLRDELVEGFTELGCHPGYVDDDLRSSYRDERELEVATLCSPLLRAELDRRGVRLVNFIDARELMGTPRP
jgi:chitin disaccharide deacetylase